MRLLLASALLCASTVFGFSSEAKISDLPAEVRQTLELVKAGGPYPYQKDGTVFRNREGLLPKRGQGYYREYTVKTPGAKDRGARRVVVGGKGELYYTADHYRSFRRIIDFD